MAGPFFECEMELCNEHCGGLMLGCKRGRRQIIGDLTKMEEKYTVTLKCKNCGSLRTAQIPCGKPWKEEMREVICAKCKVKKANWERVDLK